MFKKEEKKKEKKGGGGSVEEKKGKRGKWRGAEQREKLCYIHRAENIERAQR